MGHENRRQVRLPARLVDELARALEQALARLDVDDAGGQALGRRGRRLLAELRGRLARERPRPGDPDTPTDP